MPKKAYKKDNLKLAGLFVVVVLGLIFLSLVFKLFLVVRDSKFDSNYKFNLLIISSSEKEVVSFSPKPRSIQVLKFNTKALKPDSGLLIPIDGRIEVKNKIDIKNVSLLFLESILPLGNNVQGLTFLDLIKLTLFSRTIPGDSIEKREITDNLTGQQINTIISLTIIDPNIYQENQSIEIINASNINGIGTKLANFITNLGGNPILVINSSTDEPVSKIEYYSDLSYTVKRLSAYFNITPQRMDKRGIGDVIIIIGKDIGNKIKL